LGADVHAVRATLARPVKIRVLSFIIFFLVECCKFEYMEFGRNWI